MTTIVSIGSRVQHRGYDGWGSPGCVMSHCGERVRVYWPDENLFTAELPADLVIYGAAQPDEIAA